MLYSLIDTTQIGLSR